MEATTYVLTAQGRRFALDGEPFEMWGLRLANALEDDDHVERLIDHLDEYRSYGITAFSVFLQGALTGSANAFRADGSLVDAYMARLARIIEAADARRMVVNVGYLYQSRPAALDPLAQGIGLDERTNQQAEWPRDVFADADALKAGIVNATAWLRDRRYANVFVDIANEFNDARYRLTKPMYDLTRPDAMRELILLAKDTYPGPLVGSSVFDLWPLYRGVGDVCDIILMHGLPAAIKKQCMRHYPTKPQVENESGNMLGCLDRYDAIGVFTPEMKASFMQDAREMTAAGEHWFLFTRWQQLVPVRFGLGGDGTPENPGVRWMFAFIRDLREERAL